MYWVNRAMAMEHKSYLWLIDEGHGGVLNGHYVTSPKKMFKFPDGLTIYEGVINRGIGSRLAGLLQKAKIDFDFISDEIDDLSLPIRVQRADNRFQKDKRCIFLSIHSNASPIPTDPGSGFEIFTSKGQTKSDKIAQVFCEVYKRSFPKFAFRSDQKDGDDDKEEEFYVLRKTDCPALLVENLFFDNRKEAEYLLSDKGQQDIAECLFVSIQTVEKLKPI